ncbi:sigma-70 family RNA polymerase sigma factor [Cohnella pontilimi]|uniref:Sigma-70 family RNA polymerase sigma factor n=1 Tax=Cohnella pontilimi TaxID=2564100 RepID=A0A4U0F8N3_9BACL|nr:sigma-70 family RNA polymerase sigma factor [Cohnella pontilimi]TJY41037.1 sigma-70 family RNA polymerase sigma factor [Cohnella pontilimi]
MKFLGNADPQAFSSEEELLSELYRQMLKVARYKLYNKNDAVDVVQEAWVRILEHGSTLRDSDKLIPWAKAIASNLASNANRSKKVETIDDDYVRDLSGLGSNSEPELLAELSDLLGRLDPQARTLLLYKFYYGFRDDEIAAALSVPVGTVKARIHRSKARAKQQVREEFPHT